MEYILLMLMATCYYVLFMNDRVFKLQTQISDGCHGYLLNYLSQFKNDEEFLPHIEEFYQLKEKVYEINDRYSYFRQMFSFRKPTLESWFEGEELEIIKEGLTSKHLD